MLMLLFSLHRFYTFYASYDQGLFEQLFWNTTHGNWFQGSLSSGQSIAVTKDNQIHQVFYCHLAARRGIIRLPHLQLQLDSQEVINVDYVFVDLWRLRQYQPAFKSDNRQLKKFLPLIHRLLAEKKYEFVSLEDGVLLLKNTLPH